MRPGIGRGGRGDPVDELTGGGVRGRRPDFWVNVELRRRSGTGAALRLPAVARKGRAAALGEEAAKARAQEARPPFYRGAGAARTPAEGRRRPWPAWTMGLGGPGGRAGAGWVGPRGSAQSGRIDFLFFFEFIFNAKTNSRKA
jgi:hypothetical protein